MSEQEKVLIDYLQKLTLHFYLTNKTEEYLLMKKILIYVESSVRVGENINK